MKSNLKRVFTLVMVLMLAMSSVTFASAEANENGNIFVDPAIMNEAAMTVEEWTATEDIRVLYVVSAIVDCGATWTEADLDLFSEAIALDSVYIACDEELIFLIAFAENSYMMYTYGPELGLAFYSISESEGASAYASMAMDALLEEGLYSAYYHVPGQAIIDKMTELTAE